MANSGIWRRMREIVLTVAILSGLPTSAYAMTGPLVDTIANYLAIFIIVVMPVAGIYLFWKVHILPEKVAEKRHHPQKDAIQVLCLLSLVFGGLLWPIAWLWAYSKPVMHKLAYGTDKHEDFYREAAEEAVHLQQESTELRSEIEQLHEQEVTAETLAELRAKLAQLETRLAKTQEQTD